MKLKQIHHNRNVARRTIGLKGRPFGKPAQSRRDLQPFWDKKRPTSGYVPGSVDIPRLLTIGQFSRNPATKNRYKPHQGKQEIARRLRQMESRQ